jgi:delta-aminolevulinic acid dehydratase/porphobilinogen synthase
MLYHAAKAGAIDLRGVLEEVLLSMRRAGKFISNIQNTLRMLWASVMTYITGYFCS